MLFILAIFSCCTLCAGAAQQYSNEELSFSVPDIMENDTAWAQNNSFAYAFCDSGENIEFNVAIYENDGFSYAGMDSESLQNYAESIEDYFINAGYVVDSVTVDDYRLYSGVEGVNVKIYLGSGEKGDFYWFTTETMCYDLEFYIEDEAYATYIAEVMNTVSIKPYGDTVADEVPDVIPDDGDATGTVTGDFSAEAEPLPGEMTVGTDGITIELPDFMVEDKEWAQNAKQAILYTTTDYLFNVGIEILDNNDSVSFVGVKDKDFKAIFEELKNDAGEEYEKYELVSYETIEINGFEGIKLVLNVIEKGFNEYEKTLCMFSTKNNRYCVSILNEGTVYADYIDDIINSIKIEGKPYKEINTTVIYVIIGAVVGGISGLIKTLKKKKEKKNASVGATPIYFNPQTEAYGNGYMPNQPQQTPAQTNIDSTNGYIQNTGYAPDYDYSNKLDITLNSTDDFSKTEYRRATADMEMKYTNDEEE